MRNMLKNKKIEEQEQARGSKGLEEICGYTLTIDNSGNGGMNKDLGHKCFQKVQGKISGKDFANEYSEGVQHERFGNDYDEECETFCFLKKEAKQKKAKLSNMIFPPRCITMTRMIKNAKLCLCRK